MARENSARGSTVAQIPQPSSPGPSEGGASGQGASPAGSDEARGAAGIEIAFEGASRDRLDRIGAEFLADFLEIALRHRPEDVDVLGELGLVYTRLGRYAAGLDVDRRLVRLAPQNPTAHYNLACSLALCGEASAALDALETAVTFGYDDGPHLAADDDLASLRTEPRFLKLLAKLGG
jgi:tetratricopeptide (TPR) repeat protein